MNTSNIETSSSPLIGFKQTLESRRSIRIFDNKPIPDETIHEILNEALLAPTSSNLQTFELYHVKNQTKKDLLAKACMGQPAATTAGDLVVVVARPDLWKRNRDLLIAEMTRGGKDLPKSVSQYYHKLIPFLMTKDPFGILNVVRRVVMTIAGLSRPMVRSPMSDADFRVFGATQAALVAQTLMLSAKAHGYDSCPMGGFDEKRVKKILELPHTAEVSMVIALGVGKPEGLYGPRYRIPEEYLIRTIH